MSSAGQIVGGIVGAVVGFFTAGPGGAVQGAMYGAGIGVAVGGAIDPPKGPDLVGPRLNDLSQQTSTYGVNIPRVYGTVATRGNVFWLEGNALKEKKQKEGSGGKGGPSSTTTTYSYYATFAIGLADTLGRAPIAGVRRIWLRGKLWYDAGSDDLESVIVSNQRASGFVFYSGDDAQMPDPRMQADIGAASCPAFRGLAYVVFYDLPLADYSNTLVGVDAKIEIVSSGSIQSFDVLSTYALDGPVHVYGMSALFMDDDGVVVFKNTAPYSTPGETESYRVLHSGVTVPIARFYPANTGTHLDGWSDEPVMATASSGGVLTVQSVYGVSELSVAVPGVHYGSETHSYYQRSGAVHVMHAQATYSRVYKIFAGAAIEVFVSDAAYPYGVLHDMFPRADGGFFAVTINRFVLSFDSSWTLIWHQEVSELPLLSNSIGESEVIIRELPNGSAFVFSSSAGYAVVDAYGYEWRTTGSLGVGYEMHGGQHIIGSDVLVLASASLNSIKYVRLKNFASASPSLAYVVGAEIQQSALVGQSDIDVSALMGDVNGYLIAGGAAIRSALEPLRGAWPFDVIQSGYKIKAVPRGGSSVATINLEDLDARPYGKENSALIKRQREMDSQLPARVNVKYLDAEREYDYGEQFAEHLSTDAVGVRTVEMAIVLTSDEAAGMSQALLDMYWLERHETQFTVGPEFGALEPADVVTVASSSGDIELRLVQIETLTDERLECSARDNRSAIYTPNARGAIGSDGGAKLLLDGPSLYHLLDIPLLRSVDNSAGFPVAMSGYTAGWPGGLLMRSTDGGQVWSPLHGFSGSVPMGFAEAAVNAGRFDMPDRAKQIRVRLVYGDVFSVSLDAMLAGSNVFAYGAAGRWEIIAVQNATLGLDGVYVFDGILRGLVGTEWAAALHADGDVVVQLDDTDVAWIAADESSIGQDRLYRGITLGKDISTDASRTFAYTAENLKPLSPVLLNGNRNPATLDWTLLWTRRGRVDAQWRDLVDVPIGETSEAYDVEIYASAAYATVKRTISVTSATASYTSAQQVADFGSNQSTLYVRIYQLSTTVGRGRPLQTTITR